MEKKKKKTLKTGWRCILVVMGNFVFCLSKALKSIPSMYIYKLHYEYVLDSYRFYQWTYHWAEHHGWHTLTKHSKCTFFFFNLPIFQVRKLSGFLSVSTEFGSAKLWRLCLYHSAVRTLVWGRVTQLDGSNKDWRSLVWAEITVLSGAFQSLSLTSLVYPPLLYPFSKIRHLQELRARLSMKYSRHIWEGLPFVPSW